MSIDIKKYGIFTLLCVILVMIDQITKKLATKFLCNKEPIVLIDKILELTYTENRGAAFGILQNKHMLFYILTIFVLVLLIYMLQKLSLTKENFVFFVIIVLIFSGAVGNFIDRIKNKYVVDYIYFKLINFPVFNFADICITCGCILMILLLFTSKQEQL